MIALRICLLMLVLMVSSVALADPDEEAEAGEAPPRVEVHPPIGVFGARVHAAGDVMLSFRYQRITRDGMMIGSDEVSSLAVLDDPASSYDDVASRMTTDRVVFEAMWVPFDEFTLIIGLPYLDKEMSHLARDGGGDLVGFDTQSSGFGDTTFTVLYHVFEDHRSRTHINLGISLPSGSTTQSAVKQEPGTIERLPYIMQLGSGTVDLLPGFTYNGWWKKRLAWGGQLSGTLRAGTNSEGYTLGNDYKLTGWFGVRWPEWLHTGFRMQWQQWFGPNGEDVLMDSGAAPSLDARNQAGMRLDALFSLDLFPTGGILRGTRISLEAGLPAYQNLEGPQLRTKWFLTAGLQYAF
jgi:hypothetical protein